MASINSNECLGQIYPDEELPPKDVKFKIMEPGVIGEKNGVVREVKAHKLMLARASPIFKNMFYGSAREYKDSEITLKDTTKNAFQIMVNVIYNVATMKDSLRSKSLFEVFAVLYLVKKYKIPKLLKSVREYLTAWPITAMNVRNVAEISLMYSEAFPGESKILNTLLRSKPEVSTYQ